MAIRVQIHHTISRPISGLSPNLRRNVRAITFPSLYPKHPLTNLARNRGFPKWVIRLSVGSAEEQSPPKSTVDAQRLVGFLYEDLPHLFDDQGIDRTAYDNRVMFRDPITKHDSIAGYLFNIALLKQLFRPDFQLHWVKPVILFYLFFLGFRFD